MLTARSPDKVIWEVYSFTFHTVIFGGKERNLTYSLEITISFSSHWFKLKVSLL